MRIEQTLPPYLYTPQIAMPERQAELTDPGRVGGLIGPGVIVDISPQAQAAYARGKAESGGDAQGIGAIQAPKECQTCKNRKYVDQSDDPSVSFQAPTRLSPGQAASSVMSHEQEHVSHEQARADREGRRIVSQTVTLTTAVCPECGRVYISGGVTRTVSVKDNSGESQSNQ